MFSDNSVSADVELDRSRPSFQDEYLSANQLSTVVDESVTDW